MTGEVEEVTEDIEVKEEGASTEHVELSKKLQALCTLLILKQKFIDYLKDILSAKNLLNEIID